MHYAGLHNPGKAISDHVNDDERYNESLEHGVHSKQYLPNMVWK
nr:MAG TPA: hypothetical protein [Caudoviricetes sp.]DAZ32117.1 MAG TPA: hypothetical protein [Caudoviricetes sp.]